MMRADKLKVHRLSSGNEGYMRETIPLQTGVQRTGRGQSGGLAATTTLQVCESSQSNRSQQNRIFVKADMTATLLEEVVRLAELQSPCELRFLATLAPSAYSICAAPPRHFRSVQPPPRIVFGTTTTLSNILVVPLRYSANLTKSASENQRS